MRRPLQSLRLEARKMDNKNKNVKIQTNGSADFLTTLLWALAIALFVRTFLFQPFHIPSGSMQPNLVKGDYIITSKYSVGYGRYAADPIPFPTKLGRMFERAPVRGDVIVFKPVGESKSYIKRLIGVPGDYIQMKSGVLHINNSPVSLARIGEDNYLTESGQLSLAELWQETLPSGKVYTIYDDEKNSRADDTGVYQIPDGYYFFLGDNRDHSGDSRMTQQEGGSGLIPANNIIGRAEFVLLSVKDEFSIIRPWTWHKLRGDRFFVGLR